MFKGILYALGACALWGLVFVVPGLLKGFTPFEIAFGRCTAFGIFSWGLFFCKRKSISRFLTRTICVQALLLALVVNIIHYIALVFGLRYAGEALTTLILGMNPVAIALYGNYQKKEYSPLILVAPSLLTIGGLVMINYPMLAEVSSLEEHMWGIVCAIVALATWTWFIVTNADFLKRHPHIQSHDWVTVIGMATLAWIFLYALILMATSTSLWDDSQRASSLSNLLMFFLGTVVLGIGSTWAAHYLWNCATQHLPIALAGQLSIFETLFGLLFVYLLGMRLPVLLEAMGIIMVLSSVMIVIHKINSHTLERVIQS